MLVAAVPRAFGTPPAGADSHGAGRWRARPDNETGDLIVFFQISIDQDQFRRLERLQAANIFHQPRASRNSTSLASRIEFPTMTGRNDVSNLAVLKPR